MSRVSRTTRPSPGVTMPEEFPDDVVNMDMSDVTEPEIGLTTLSRRVDLHRVTLLRMEQRGVLPKARWRRKPIPHRVYNEAEVEAIIKILAERGEKEGREFVD